MMAAALTLLELGSTERELTMFDAFTEMPRPDEHDTHISGRGGPEFFEEVVAGDPAYALLPLERVRELLEGTGYPAERLRFVPGWSRRRSRARPRRKSRSCASTPTGTARRSTRCRTSTHGFRAAES